MVYISQYQMKNKNQTLTDEVLESAIEKSSLFTGLKMKNMKIEYLTKEEVLIKFYDVDPSIITDVETTSIQPVSPIRECTKNFLGRPYVTVLLTLYKSSGCGAAFLRSSNCCLDLPQNEIKFPLPITLSRYTFADLFVSVVDLIAQDLGYYLAPDIDEIMKERLPEAWVSSILLFYRFVNQSTLKNKPVKSVKTHIDDLITLLNSL